MTNPLATKIQKPSCIDFILTNSPLRFYRNDILLTRLSDCDKLQLLVFKTSFSKSKPKEIINRNFKKFNEKNFNQELRSELAKNYSSFENVFIHVLNKHASIIENVIKASDAP